MSEAHSPRSAQILRSPFRTPGESRSEHSVRTSKTPLGHCTGCHRGVFLATIVGIGKGEPFGLCARCES